MSRSGVLNILYTVIILSCTVCECSLLFHKLTIYLYFTDVCTHIISF